MSEEKNSNQSEGAAWKNKDKAPKQVLAEWSTWISWCCFKLFKAAEVTFAEVMFSSSLTQGEFSLGFKYFEIYIQSNKFSLLLHQSW